MPEVPSNREIKKPPQEIEVKVLNVGGREEFEKTLHEIKAKTFGEKDRLLADTRYAMDPKKAKFGSIYSFEGRYADITNSQNAQNLQQALEFLGFEVAHDRRAITLTEKVADPKAEAVRIRNDNGKFSFTVKGPSEKSETSLKRDEINVTLENSQLIVDFLAEVGYIKDSYREKERTTYTLVYKGVDVKIDYNISPLEQVRPWLEIECPKPEYILEVAQLLGYNKADLFVGSDADMYSKKYGLKKRDYSNLSFKE